MELDELVEHWTLLVDEQELIGQAGVSGHVIPQVRTGVRHVIPHPVSSSNSPWGRRCAVVWWVLLAGHADLRPLGGPDGSDDGQEDFRRGGSDRVVRALGGREVSGADQREPESGPEDGAEVPGPGAGRGVGAGRPAGR